MHHRLLVLARDHLHPRRHASSWSGRGRGLNPPSTVRLDVTRDTWVSEVGPKADGNNGGASRLKLKSIQEMTLLDIDAETASWAGRSDRPCST